MSIKETMKRQSYPPFRQSYPPFHQRFVKVIPPFRQRFVKVIPHFVKVIPRFIKDSSKLSPHFVKVIPCFIKDSSKLPIVSVIHRLPTVSVIPRQNYLKVPLFLPSFPFFFLFLLVSDIISVVERRDICGERRQRAVL